MQNIDMVKVRNIMKAMECPAEFKCAASDFRHHCARKDIGATYFFDCRASNQKGCDFSVRLADARLCSCPLRVYIGKTMPIWCPDRVEQYPWKRETPLTILPIDFARPW